MFIRFLNRVEEGVIALLLVATTLLVFIDVVLRFGFGTGLLWSQELTLHMSAWFVLFGASYGVKVGAHIGVDAVVRVLPRRARRIVSLVAVAGALVYCGLFLAGSWTYLAKMYRIGIEMEDLPVPLWIAHGVLLVGLALLALRLVQLLWRMVTGGAEGFRFADEAEESMHLVGADEEERP